MPSVDAVEAFVDLVEQGQTLEAMTRFYAEHATMRENQAAPRVGKAALLQHEQAALESVAGMKARCLRPWLVSGDTVVIRWVFDIQGKDGKTSRLEELAYQRWEGDLLAEEQFFYDPAQFRAPQNPDVAVLQAFFDAINRHDMDAMAAHFAADVLRVEPEGFATSGTYRGLEAVRDKVRQGRDTWAEGSCDPEEFLVHSGRVLVYLHARVRLKNTGEWVGGRFADGFVLRDSLITEYRTFWDRQAARLWAGLAAPPPP